MKHLILLIGPPASGKTTYSKAQVGWHCIESDAQDGQPVGTTIALLRSALAKHDRVVMDGVPAGTHARQAYVDAGREVGAKITAVVFEMDDLQTIYERGRDREHVLVANAGAFSQYVHAYLMNYDPVTTDEVDEIQIITVSSQTGQR